MELVLAKSVRIGGVMVDAGSKISGSQREIEEFLAHAKNASEYHYSSTKGQYIHVSEMNTFHIRNTLAALYKKFADAISEANDEKSLLEVMEKCDPANSEEVKNLLRELITREQGKPHGLG